MDYREMAQEVERQEAIRLLNEFGTPLPEAFRLAVERQTKPEPQQSRVQWESKGRMPARGKL